MRLACFLFLVLFAAAVGAFAYFNQEPTTVRFAGWSFTSSLAAVAGVIYLLGMLSGWTVLRLLRRSAGDVVDAVEHRYVARR